jgi:NADPH:quinone reductase-like Zn-dependent oxidoreductase
MPPCASAQGRFSVPAVQEIDMTMTAPTAETMRTLRFHEFGEPAEVLRLEQASRPEPLAGTVAVRVEACGLNPADWALCRGLFPDGLPRGIGLDVCGTVSAIGAGISDVAVGDRVLGPADYVNFPTAGASDHAVLSHWAPVPDGLGPIEAAALPMVVETGYRYVAFLDPKPGETLVVNGAGTMVGFSAVQIALLKGVKVVAIAGDTFADQLRAFGAEVTPRGDGLVERLAALLPQVPDHVLDVAPVNLTPGAGAASALPDLVKVAGGDPRRVITVADFAGAAATGVRTGMEDITSIEEAMQWDKLGLYAGYAADGRFSIPVARTFALEDWREALEISLNGTARGKLVLLVA